MSAARRRVAVLLVAACSSVASASTPEAWARERRAAAQSCIAASGLSGTRVTRQPAVFDDRIGYDALLVAGRARQRWLHGRLVTMLCLYDRRTGRAQAIEAPGWPTPLR